MTKKSYIAAIITALALVLLAWWGFSRWGGSSAEIGGGVRFGVGEETAPAPAAGAGASESFPPSSLAETYRALADRFSFKYPSGFSVKAQIGESQESRIYTIENGRGEGIQITLSPFDEAGDALTAERIESETGIVPLNPEPVMGDDGKTIGLGFIAENTSFGRSREIWFVASGRLFQVSAPILYDNLAKAVLQSFKFE